MQTVGDARTVITFSNGPAVMAPECRKVPCSDEMEQRWAAADWKAWHTRRPAQPPIIYVQGQCEFPTTGYRVGLRRSLAQGIDPAILVLDLVISKSTESESLVVTRMVARYEEKTRQRHEKVQIRPYDIMVIVEEVS